jgi:hypothetical protein
MKTTLGKTPIALRTHNPFSASRNRFLAILALGITWGMVGNFAAIAQQEYELVRIVPYAGAADTGNPTLTGDFNSFGGSFSASVTSGGVTASHTYSWTFDRDVSTITAGDAIVTLVQATKDRTATSARVRVSGSDGVTIDWTQAPDLLTANNWNQSATYGRVDNTVFSGDSGFGTTTSLFNNNSFSIHIDPTANSEFIIIRAYIEGLGVDSLTRTFLYVFKKVEEIDIIDLTYLLILKADLQRVIKIAERKKAKYLRYKKQLKRAKSKRWKNRLKMKIRGAVVELNKLGNEIDEIHTEIHALENP